MKLISSKSLLTKSVVRTGIIVASLALAGNAFAAGVPIPHAAAANTVHATYNGVAGDYRNAAAQSVNVAQILQGLYGMRIPVHVTAGTADDAGGYDPTFDSPSPTVDVDNSQSQQAIDETDQAIQQMDQDTFQMDESVINNGM
jgi:hypothetical protein